jgi:hypothetical protein
MGGISTRELVKQAYPGPKWAAKVNAMTDAQVVAIFFKLKRQGRIA